MKHTVSIVVATSTGGESNHKSDYYAVDDVGDDDAVMGPLVSDEFSHHCRANYGAIIISDNNSNYDDDCYDN